jgi:hypothetical protein
MLDMTYQASPTTARAITAPIARNTLLPCIATFASLPDPNLVTHPLRP